MSDELAQVVLRGIPVELHRRAESHGATLRRELALVHTADESGNPPARLLWLSNHASGQYDEFIVDQRVVIEQASSSSGETIDLVFRLPVHAADAAEELARTLAEVDAFCRSGDLVTLAAAADVLAYQSWFLGQFIDQLRAGADPIGWQEWLGSSSTTPAPEEHDAGVRVHPATITIDDDLDLEGSARLRGELARLLDEGVDDLVVDLARCAYIDSVGVSLLLTTLETIEHGGGRLRIVDPTPRVARILRTAGVLDVLTSGG
jgi:anti-sigma B factor antagonist